jgi:enoyl-CoA hydratase/carnithine racemase
VLVSFEALGTGVKMKYKDIQVQVDGHNATLLLDRPEKRNALSLNTLEEMIHAL